MRPVHLSWLAVLVPPVLETGVRLQAGGPLLASSLVGSLPALLLAAGALRVHRRQASPLERRLAKELRQVLVPGLVLAAASPLLALPVAAELLGPRAPLLAELLFLLGAPLTVAAGFGLELEGPLLLEYLARPLSRRRLIAEKWAVGTGVVAAGLGQYLALAEGWALALASALLAVGLVPLVLARVRQTTFAALSSGLLAATLVGAPRLQGLGVMVSGLLAAAAGFGFWRGLDALAREPVADALLGRLVALRGRRAPLVALAAKELQLHLGSMLVMGAMVVAFGVQQVLAPGETVATSVTLLFLGLVVALWSGVAPILGEHRYGTFHQDRATLPTALVWRAKAGVALLVALVGGAVLPIALAKAGNTAAGWRDLGLWALLVAMATGVGLVASALLRDLSRAFLVALAATVALVMLFSGSLMAGLAVLPSLPEGLVRVVGGLAPATRPVLMGVLLACQASLAAWLAFGLARRAWLGTGPRWRSTLGESAALVGASLVAGVGQAMLMFAP